MQRGGGKGALLYRKNRLLCLSTEGVNVVRQLGKNFVRHGAAIRGGFLAGQLPWAIPIEQGIEKRRGPNREHWREKLGSG
jgi:hypothetical protein